MAALLRHVLVKGMLSSSTGRTGEEEGCQLKPLWKPPFDSTPGEAAQRLVYGVKEDG
jgi:hypothetical protein